MSDSNRNDFIKKARIFSSLNDSEIEQIISRFSVKQFMKGDTILYEEDTNQYMYVIMLGRVKVVRTTEEGKEIILAIHKSGSFFGEMSLIDGKTAPASIIAIEDSLIAIISKKDFFDIVFNQNKVTVNLLRILCERLRKSWDTIQLLNFNNASQRTKTMLLMLADEHGTKSAEGTTIHIKLTHQEISDMTGLTRETVTRVIDKMQKSGEIVVIKESKFIRLTPDFIKRDESSLV